MNMLGKRTVKELMKSEKEPKCTYVVNLAVGAEDLNNLDKCLSFALKKKPTVDQLKVLVELYDMPYIRLDKTTYESELYNLTDMRVY